MMENLGRGWAVPAPWRKPCGLPGHGGTYLGIFDNCEAWTFKTEYKCITGVLTVEVRPVKGLSLMRNCFGCCFTSDFVYISGCFRSFWVEDVSDKYQHNLA